MNRGIHTWSLRQTRSGSNLPPLPEEGTDDIRQTTAAFNRMQTRLFRFIEDRTRMLAAIGHDLRTPLTSLRLRAEFVTDPEIQQRMLATIDEIQAMTEATIAFARGEATIEETRTVDLNALIGSLCDDLAEMDQPVAYAEGKKMIYRCRPDSLRRALRNIIENALRYGGEARVRLYRGSHSVDITVEDNGPGIPEDMHEQVFAPFCRIETSRNRETGGVGLGLAIARTIIRHHGGDIVFSNDNPCFRVTISLPTIL
ncbi:sensor histidine kinase [Paracoccus denitrificans]|jgi:signal transduction histidine kinase|nr:ATP-binding protein [Paracoccus denitrificans]MBB4629606.1 signal transduction histidine kinase [Paracoccus denitrificans]